MLAGLIGGHAGQVEVGQVAERATAAGQPDLAHAADQTPLRQHLEDRVVLAVDRQQGGAVLADRRHEQRPGHHQGLLVGEQDALASPRRGEIGGEARGADDAGNHRIDGAISRGLSDRVRAALDAGIEPLRAQLRRQPVGSIGVCHDREPRPEVAAETRHGLDVAVRDQGIGRKTARMPAHDVERLHTDRASGTEDADTCRHAHAPNPASQRPPAQAGSAAASASTRSSRPPWPGRQVPLSLTPATRFIHDS